MKPLISVIIPCYNSEMYIDRCLNSIINQSIGLDKLEIIIINDASTDNTYEKILEWESRYSNQLIVINMASNSRQGTCRNIGIKYATGKYISFIDSDDWIDINMYDKLCRVMEHYNCDIASCEMSFEREYSNKVHPSSDLLVDQIIINTDEERRKFLYCVYLKTVNMLYRKEYILKHDLYFLENMIYEDKYFQELTCMTVQNICFINEKLYYCYARPDSTSRNLDSKSHYDYILVIRYIWEEFERRNHLERFRDVLEFRMISNYYSIAMKMMILRFGSFPYDMYCEVCKYIKRIIPNYKENISYYLTMDLTGILKSWLVLLDSELTEKQMQEMADYYKKYTF